MEVEFQKLGHLWKDESQSFPTNNSRTSEDISWSSYGRFEVVPPPAEFVKNHSIVQPPADAEAWTDGDHRLCAPPYKMISNLVANMVSVSVTFPLIKGHFNTYTYRCKLVLTDRDNRNGRDERRPRATESLRVIKETLTMM